MPLERLKLIIFGIAATFLISSLYHLMRRSSIKSVITSWSRCLSGLIDLCTLGGRTPSSVTLVEDTFLPSTFNIAIAIVIPSSLGHCHCHTSVRKRHDSIFQLGWHDYFQCQTLWSKWGWVELMTIFMSNLIDMKVLMPQMIDICVHSNSELWYVQP